jgi:hypothetical protein
MSEGLTEGFADGHLKELDRITVRLGELLADDALSLLFGQDLLGATLNAGHWVIGGRRLSY